MGSSYFCTKGAAKKGVTRPKRRGKPGKPGHLKGFVGQINTISVAQAMKLRSFMHRMRKKPTAAEKALRNALDDRPAFGFRYQVPFIVSGEMFIVDFYCASRRLVVKIDGGYHNTTEQWEEDQRRENALLSLKAVKQIRRYTNETVLDNIDAVRADILRDRPMLGTWNEKLPNSKKTS